MSWAPLETLLGKWQDGNLSREELEALTSLLQEESSRRLLVEWFDLGEGLATAFQERNVWNRRLAGSPQFGEEDLVRASAMEEALGPRARTFGRFAAGRVFGIPAWIRVLGLASTAAALVIWWGALKEYAGEEVNARLMGDPAAVSLSRQAFVIHPSGRGIPLRIGDRIEVAPNRRAEMVFGNEPTEVRMKGPARLRVDVDLEGKALVLEDGALRARVAPQAPSRPMTIRTPHALLRLSGAELSMSVSGQTTRVDVIAGAVDLMRTEDGQRVTVYGGYSAKVSAGEELAASKTLPEPWNAQNIGRVGQVGHARFEGQRCFFSGAGRGWGDRQDDFHFVYQKLEGDGEIRAQVLEFEGKDPRARAGVVIRGNLRSRSPTAFLSVKAGRGLVFMRRSKQRGQAEEAGAESFPYWVRLVRRGSTITAYKSPDGEAWTETVSERFNLGPTIYVGLCVFSANPADRNMVVFDNVKVARYAEESLGED